MGSDLGMSPGHAPTGDKITDPAGTVNGHRRTVAATVAASAARRHQKALRLAQEIAPRVHLLPSDILLALAFVVVSEIETRNLPLPEPEPR